MKKDTTEAKRIKKQPYVKPAIEVTHLAEDLCLVSVSQQKPPMDDGDNSQDDNEETPENELLKTHSVWDN